MILWEKLEHLNYIFSGVMNAFQAFAHILEAWFRYTFFKFHINMALYKFH